MIGSRLYQLGLEGTAIIASEKKADVIVGDPIPFPELVLKMEEAHLIMLAYYKERSGLTVDNIIERLLESEELPGVVAREQRLMWSHAQ